MRGRRFGSIVSVNEGTEKKKKSTWNILRRRTNSNSTVSKNNVELVSRQPSTSTNTSPSNNENLPPIPRTPKNSTTAYHQKPSSSQSNHSGTTFSSGNSVSEHQQSANSELSRTPRSMIHAQHAPSNPPPPVPGSNHSYYTPKRLNNDFIVGNGTPTPQAKSFVTPTVTPSAKPVLPAKPVSQPKEEEKENSQVIEKTGRYPKVKLNGLVGFASLPYQVVRRCQSKGFQFNLLCVGETGTGKTTLIESLFGITLNEFNPCDNELNTVELKTKECEITEGEVNVKLRVVETAGFGDQLDKNKSAKVIVDFINDQFEARLRDELMVKRNLSAFDDKRIHACLYFISPTGHGLKALDIVTMKELSKRVNVIPVIAKSDTTSKEELARFKAKILSELKSHNIEIYQFPTDDEAVAEQNRKMNSFIPFAVVGSVDTVTKEDGSVVRARRYPWGIVEVENKEHCDFVYLREAVLRINVDSLRERTQYVLYEAYRRERLRELKIRDGDTGPNMEKACELRNKEFERELEKSEETFMRDFERRVREKEAEIGRRSGLLKMRREEVEREYQDELTKLEQQIAQLTEEKNRLEGKGSTKDSGKKARK
ncbi:unnamed protein product [Bursaphelenchus okinawaensis]|uniref:Septin-type G domain-containing protein n=1 Tax=Bursaphelenchus okinawaensis TaxID=465554 RepID=A0A811LND8_9BILA|nr:unnamed protein product [Bursaphelenchus okinawaensis]CAG9125957.1 unnamed protein product [Bursaphelenchus okinawaensis]